MAMGGTPEMAPGHTAFGHNFFQAGAPKPTSGILTNFSSFRGMRNPLFRNAMPKAFSFGGITWHVRHDVSYRRAKIGNAETGSARANKSRLETTIRGNTVVYLPRDRQK